MFKIIICLVPIPPYLLHLIVEWSINKYTCLNIIQKICVRFPFGMSWHLIILISSWPVLEQEHTLNIKLKITLFLRKAHKKPLFNESSILNLNNIYRYFSFLEVFNILKFKSPISIHEFERQQSSIPKLNLPNIKLDKTKHTLR